MPGPSGSASTTTAGPVRAATWPSAHANVVAPAPPLPPITPITSPRAARVAEVGQRLDQPGLGARQLGDVSAPTRQRRPGTARRAPRPTRRRRPRRGAAGASGPPLGDVGAEQHQRRARPSRAARRRVVGDVGGDPGRGGEPQQLVEQGLVAGDEAAVRSCRDGARAPAPTAGNGSPVDDLVDEGWLRHVAPVDAGRRRAPLRWRHGARPTAAFFDLDKTIIAKSSTLAFSKPFQAGGLISRRAVLRSAYAQFVYLVGGADHDQMEKMRQFMSQLVRRLGRRDGPRDRRRHPAQHRRPAGVRRGRVA